MATMEVKLDNGSRVEVEYKVQADTSIIYLQDEIYFDSLQALIRYVRGQNKPFAGNTCGLQYVKVGAVEYKDAANITFGMDGINPVDGFTDWRLPTVTEARLIDSNHTVGDVWVDINEKTNMAYSSEITDTFNPKQVADLLLVRDMLDSDNFIELFDDRATYEEACEAITRLNKDNYGGHQWRLPGETDEVTGLPDNTWFWTGMRAYSGAIIVGNSTNRENDILINVRAHPGDRRTAIAVRVVD